MSVGLRLYFQTVKHMKMRQIVRRLARTSTLDVAMTAANAPTLCGHGVLLPQTDLAQDYLARFDLDALMEGELLLLNDCHSFPLGVWKVPEASHLWNFNLHYFEYAIALGAAFRDTLDTRYFAKFKELVEDWIATCTYPQGDAWHPYTISLRLINWLVCCELFSEALTDDVGFDVAMQKSMYLQYRHLLFNQETHLLANHYFENLKTLVIFSKLFDEDDVFTDVWKDFETQLNEQVLSDGVHFERSLMYHKLVLEGALRVASVLQQFDGSMPSILMEKAQAMLDAMVSLEKGMGKTPFFNDSADGIAKECGHLAAACKAIFGIDPVIKDSFRETGYYKLYDDNIAVMVDAGQPGPSYMLGHAHCDVLSYELSYDGKPIIVNSGTYAYQSELRPWFRSTAAHNTAMFEGREQMECWGEHRVARRISNVSCKCDRQKLVGQYRSYHGDEHVRTLNLQDKEMIVVGSFKTKHPGTIRSFLHLAPGFDVASDAVRTSDMSMMITSNAGSGVCIIEPIKCQYVVHRHDGYCGYSPQFGILQEGVMLEFIASANQSGCGYRVSFVKKEVQG